APLSPHSPFEQGAAALFYACSSLLVIFINKIVLTTYGFPSFQVLAMSQFAATGLTLRTLQAWGWVQIKPLTREALSSLVPLTALFCMNVVTGLGGTKKISLPMFTVLRRFSILMTMLMEQHLLGSKPNHMVQLSVFLMLGGAVVAAMYDLTFDLTGYLYILSNDLFTAGYGVAMKHALTSGKVTKMSLLFYNSVFSLLFMAGLLYATGSDEVAKVRQFEFWGSSQFLLLFAVASFMGCVLQYSIFLCTSVNSALTTTVVGCLKNILTSLAGMFVGGDYVFSVPNFAGLIVSVIGSLVYSYAKYIENR
ncbi:unnamed protein product, partial [Phaeothamnion confervicola]